MKNTLQNIYSNIVALPAAVKILIVGNFINRLGHFVIPFLALYLTKQGYSLTDAGIAISLHASGVLIAAMIGGQLADTIGRRNTILASLIGNGLAVLGMYASADLNTLLLFSVLNGLSSGLSPLPPMLCWQT